MQNMAKAIIWFLKEKHFRTSKVRAMSMMLNGALLSLLFYQQNLFGFFQNNNENKCEYKNKETVRRLPRRLCTEDLFRQTREHRLEQTYLSDALMPDEIMNPRYKFLSKLMREVLVFLDSYKDPSFDFLHLFSTSIPVFNMFLHLLEIWHLLNRTWFKLMFWADFVPVTTGDPTAATSPETKWIIKYRIKQKSA